MLIIRNFSGNFILLLVFINRLNLNFFLSGNSAVHIFIKLLCASVKPWVIKIFCCFFFISIFFEKNVFGYGYHLGPVKLLPDKSKASIDN